MEVEEVDGEESPVMAVNVRPKVERKKVRTATNRRTKSPLRPQSATEVPQRPRVKTNNLTDFEEMNRIAMETSVASATMIRSVTPSTASGVSFQWVNGQMTTLFS